MIAITINIQNLISHAFTFSIHVCITEVLHSISCNMILKYFSIFVLNSLNIYAFPAESNRRECGQSRKKSVQTVHYDNLG